MSPAALQEARRLYREARGHHLEEARQRTQARQKMEQIRMICIEYGIEFELVKGGAPEHGQPSPEH